MSPRVNGLSRVTTRTPKMWPKRAQRNQKQILNWGWFLISTARMRLPSAGWSYGAKRCGGSILSFLFGGDIFERVEAREKREIFRGG